MATKITALAGAAAAALAVAPVWAHDDAPVAARTATTGQAAQVKMTTASSMTVVRDAQTGKLRAPTAEEMEALLSSGRGTPREARSHANPAAASFTSPATGAKGLHLGEDAFAYSVAKRNLDGSLSEVCVTGESSAQKVLAAPRHATVDQRAQGAAE